MCMSIIPLIYEISSVIVPYINYILCIDELNVYDKHRYKRGDYKDDEDEKEMDVIFPDKNGSVVIDVISDTSPPSHSPRSPESDYDMV